MQLQLAKNRYHPFILEIKFLHIEPWIISLVLNTSNFSIGDLTTKNKGILQSESIQLLGKCLISNYNSIHRTIFVVFTMTIEFFLSFLLGVVITLSLSSFIKTDSGICEFLKPPETFQINCNN